MARVTRAAMVGSVTRNAWAMSPVLTPHTRRRVNATCASRARAGWQQVKIRRRRSSGTASSPRSSISVPSGSTSSGSFDRNTFSRRSTSSALRLAVAVSQAPGLRGTPSRAQAARAET